jgi:hypothetical protein
VPRPLTQRIDLFALAGAVLAFLVTALYLFLVYAEGGRPSSYAVGILVVAILGAAYAVRMGAKLRRPVLGVSAVCLFLLGFVALFSIGLPLILAALLCVLGAMRSRTRDWRDTV